jgi:hypothetical protein
MPEGKSNTRPPKLSALDSPVAADMLASILTEYATLVDATGYAGALQRKYATEWSVEIADKFGTGLVQLADRAPSRNGAGPTTTNANPLATG